MSHVNLSHLTQWRNPYRDRRDAHTWGLVLGVLAFVIIVGVLAVVLLQAAVP